MQENLLKLLMAISEGKLDEVGKILNPEFDPNASIRRNGGGFMS